VIDIGKYAFYNCTGLTSITIGSGIKSIGSQAFAKCSDLTDMYCYAENVPNTNSDAFTDSHIEYATLHVPEESLNTYKAVEPWSGFKNILKIMPMYTLTYMIDDDIYKSYQVEEGATITPETYPTKEGYTFSGWSEIPATMPAHDVTVTGTFTQETGIDQIMDSENGKATIFTIDGKCVDNPKKGVNVIRMKDGTTRKVVVK
jgi:hypothetical protein